MNLRGVSLVCVLAAGLITACAHKNSPPPTTPAVVPVAPVPILPPGLPPTPSTASTIPAVTTTPVYVPDYSHAGQQLPEGIFSWDSLMKGTDVLSGADFAHFTFSFTNLTKDKVTILNVHPSCGCTTAQLPPVPWTIPPGASGEIKFNVNLAGKFGTVFKSAKVTTDKGFKDLMLRINIQQPPPIQMTAQQIADGIAKAKVDRQAVFKGDCASCHLKNVDGKYGEQLFTAVCGVCHEAVARSTMVPDLNKLNVPTNREFWRTWITFGKPGSLMPAFATSQGGPLTDMQIASLAAYLNAVKPSKVAPLQ